MTTYFDGCVTWYGWFVEIAFERDNEDVTDLCMDLMEIEP